MSQPIIVHYLEDSRGTRALWLLEELGVPYEIKAWKRHPKTMLAPKELKDVHPSGKSPLVVDSDGKVLAESGFICRYLIEKYGKETELYPRNKDESDDIDFNLFSAESNYMTVALQIYVNKMACKQAPPGASFLLRKLFNLIESKFARPELELCLSILNDQVAKNGYIAANHLTGADIMYENNISLTLGMEPDVIDKYPALQEWLKKLHARPAYKRAVTKGAESIAKL